MQIQPGINRERWEGILSDNIVTKYAGIGERRRTSAGLDRVDFKLDTCVQIVENNDSL